MASLAGQLTLLRIPSTDAVAIGEDLPNENTFITIAGLTNLNETNSATVIDVTNVSSGENRQLLNGHGVLSFNLTFTAYLQNDPVYRRLEVLKNNQNLVWFRVEYGDGSKKTARFKIASLSKASPYDSAITADISLESSGALTVEDSVGNVYQTSQRKFTNLNGTLANVLVGFGKYQSAITNFPTEANRQSVIQGTLDTQTKVNNVLSGYSIAQNIAPGSVVQIQGADNASNYALTMLLFLKSQVNGKIIQVTDSLGSNVVIEPVGEYTYNHNNTGNLAYLLYFINMPLANGENFPIQIEVGG